MSVSAYKYSNLLRFQQQILDLGNNCFQVLQFDEFRLELRNYLLRLIELGHTEVAVAVIEKLGDGTEDNEVFLRERALSILLDVAECVEVENDEEFFAILIEIISNWLRHETEYYSGFDIVCLQLFSIIRKILLAGLWELAEPIVGIIHQIQCSIILKHILFRGLISRLCDSLADEHMLRLLVNAFLSKAAAERDVVRCLLAHFGNRAGRYLINELFDCDEREKRYSILDIIPSNSSIIIPSFIERFEERQPWYVIRNGLVLLSRLDDPDLYTLARPFLLHRDIRVQEQVIDCIVTLGGKEVGSRLAEALPLVEDEVKLHLVKILAEVGGEEVATALLTLLESRERLSPGLREDLIATICSLRLFAPSNRGSIVLGEIIEERTDKFGAPDRVVREAKALLWYLEDKDRDVHNVQQCSNK